jgi:hypothetical protein
LCERPGATPHLAWREEAIVGAILIGATDRASLTTRHRCVDWSLHWDFDACPESQTHTKPTGTDGIGVEPHGGNTRICSAFARDAAETATP